MCPFEKHNDKAEFLYYKGLCHEKLNQTNEAMINYKKCISINPNHFDGCY